MVKNDQIIEEKSIQEEMYNFPYHYIPNINNDCVSNIRELSWGMDYFAYLLYTVELVENLEVNSILDVGCGDGRWLGILGNEYKKTGVDFSEKAIRFARAFHPEIEFCTDDIKRIEKKFDLVASIEVLEHIPEESIHKFIEALGSRCKSGGYLLITVPTTVKEVNKKHFRHYTLFSLRKQLNLLDSEFAEIRYEYLLGETFFYRFFKRLCYNSLITIEISLINKIMWEYVWSKLRISDSKNGRKLLMLLRKK